MGFWTRESGKRHRHHQEDFWVGGQKIGGSEKRVRIRKMNGNLGSKKWEFWSNFEISGGEKMVNFVRFWVKNGQKWLKMVNFWGRDEKMVDFSSFRKSAWGETSLFANFGFPGQGVGREKGSNLRNQMEMA